VATSKGWWAAVNDKGVGGNVPSNFLAAVENSLTAPSATNTDHMAAANDEISVEGGQGTSAHSGQRTLVQVTLDDVAAARERGSSIRKGGNAGKLSAGKMRSREAKTRENVHLGITARVHGARFSTEVYTR
jgi:hypothetical protein